jgi:hypothetical protein
MIRRVAGIAAVALALGLVLGGCGRESDPAPTEASSPADLSPAFQTQCPAGGCGGGFTGCSDSDGNNPYVFGNVRQFSDGQVVQYHSDVCGSSTWVVEWICYPSSPGGTPAQMNTNCPHGCSLGKCLP